MADIIQSEKADSSFIGDPPPSVPAASAATTSRPKREKPKKNEAPFSFPYFKYDKFPQSLFRPESQFFKPPPGPRRFLGEYVFFENLGKNFELEQYLKGNAAKNWCLMVTLEKKTHPNPSDPESADNFPLTALPPGCLLSDTLCSSFWVAKDGKTILYPPKKHFKFNATAESNYGVAFPRHDWVEYYTWPYQPNKYAYAYPRSWEEVTKILDDKQKLVESELSDAPGTSTKPGTITVNVAMPQTSKPKG